MDCRFFLSFVFLGGARRLELSPYNTQHVVRGDAWPMLVSPQHYTSKASKTAYRQLRSAWSHLHCSMQVSLLCCVLECIC